MCSSVMIWLKPFLLILSDVDYRCNSLIDIDFTTCGLCWRTKTFQLPPWVHTHARCGKDRHVSKTQMFTSSTNYTDRLRSPVAMRGWIEERSIEHVVHMQTIVPQKVPAPARMTARKDSSFSGCLCWQCHRSLDMFDNFISQVKDLTSVSFK